MWLHEPASPESLRAFSAFVRTNVQEHSNTSASLSPGDVLAFGAHQLRHGLSGRTIVDAVRQLTDERRGRRGRWARASVLDRFQWDLFRWYWNRESPAFATFFSNSTAHYQHVFWRNLEPDKFLNQPTEDDQRRFGGAILHGYQQMDRIVGEALDLIEGTDTVLMLCTGLSQQPYLQAEDTGGKFIHRPHRFDDVIDALAIQDVQQVAPVMAEQFHLFFDDAAQADAAAEQLRAATVDGRPAFTVRVVDNDVFTGCSIHDPVAPGAMLRGEAGSAPFESLFYRSEAPKSGFHHPDGMWWTRTGSGVALAEPVPLRSVAPTILRLIGVRVPDSMLAPPVGAMLAAV